MKSSFIFLFFILLGCSATKNTKNLSQINSSALDNINWYQKDYALDGIPGISLEKWYNTQPKKTKNQIIVAVLDTQIDLNHEDLKSQIWTNPNEIPNNGIDDDKNGYVDDVNGWNFLGTKSGNYIVWTNFEYVRIIREWSPLFANKKEDEIESNSLLKYKDYQRAVSYLAKNKKHYNGWLKSLNHDIDVFPLIKDTLKHFFPKENYTYKQLDSLYKIYKINDKSYRQRRDDNDKDLGALIFFMMTNMESNDTDLSSLKEQQEKLDSVVNKNLNLNYNERVFIDNNSNILEKGYGSNQLCPIIKGIKRFHNHNTEVSSIIAANRKNNIGIKGFSDSIKIMPLNISASGDENDKDIAMAIYYAIDNGAKVINMSFSKEFSIHKEWVFDAIKYAEKNNVLIVHCSGNNGLNIDENPLYPNDYDYNDKGEISNNFITVGSISKKKDSLFVSNFSNYGKQNIDIFAPGEEIYTAFPDNKYDFDSGTSLAAPMVSGTAALIWLYYPTLTVQEVKYIILESGTPYDIEVLIPGGNGKKAKFSELSKSGKVLNVYNAMQMAKELSLQKKQIIKY